MKGRKETDKAGIGVNSNVIVCLTSSIAMMHTLSKVINTKHFKKKKEQFVYYFIQDIVELLLKMLKLFPSDEDPLLADKQDSDSEDSSIHDIQDEQEDFLQICGNIVSKTNSKHKIY